MLHSEPPSDVSDLFLDQAQFQQGHGNNELVIRGAVVTEVLDLGSRT